MYDWVKVILSFSRASFVTFSVFLDSTRAGKRHICLTQGSHQTEAQTQREHCQFFMKLTMIIKSLSHLLTSLLNLIVV